MHFIVSWDINEEGDEWKKLNKELRGCLSGYSWVKPLTTLYIIQVEDDSERDKIRDALVEVCRNNPKKIYLLVSPAVAGGTYGGWLPKSLWPKIRKRVEEAADEF